MAEEQQGGDSSQPRAGSWYSEKNLRPEVRKALDELEPKRGKEQRFYKEPPELKARVDKMIEGAKHISDPPKYKIGPVSEEEKLLAWHKAIGSSQRVIDFEIEELRREREAPENEDKEGEAISFSQQES